MSRHSQQTAAIALGLALIASLGAEAPAAQIRPAGAGEPRRPNVLIIVTDDQRSGLQVMPATRRIFRAGGRNFTHAYATTPTCCPSRASIFTGNYAHNHGVTNNDRARRLDHRRTLQHKLRKHGYHTAIFGKFLNRWPVSRRPPFFDDWAITSASPDKVYYGGKWNVNGEMHTVSKYSTTFIRRQTLRFLDRRERGKRDSRPWLTYVTVAAPHGPFTSEPKYDDARVPGWKGNPAVFEKNRSDKPPYVLAQHHGYREGKTSRRKQFRTLMSVDDLTKAVFRKLNRYGETKNTLAFFISDNGRMWSEHGLAGKTVPYRPSVGIPLLMRWPGKVSRGSSDSRLAANIDIAPTVLDAVGLWRRRIRDGRSLLAGGWDRKWLLGEYSVGEHDPTPTWGSIFNEKYQYTEYYTSGSSTPTFSEYYDLEKDPWELRNVLGDGDPLNNPDVVKLSNRLAKEKHCRRSSCP